MKNKSNIKIIFTDLDWTLFDHNQLRYIPSGLEALKKARDNGIKVIICTSRTFCSLEHVDAFNQIPHDGYISNNGAIAKAENTYLYRYSIPEDIVRKLLQEFKDRSLVAMLISYDQSFLNMKEDDKAKGFYDNWLEYRPSVKEYNGEEITSMLLFAKEDEDEFLNNYPITKFRFFENGEDVNSRPHLKSDGVEAVLDYYGFSKDEAIAIGDDIADIEMFHKVKYGIAMGNGKEEVKKAAYLVADRIENDGLAKALKELGVIE